MNALLRPRPVACPRVRLVVFPHAGGSGAGYFPLSRGLPPDWDLVLVDLPGRGRRHRMRPLTDMPAIVEHTAADLMPFADAPLALFGHSLGAVVAVETTRALQGRGVVPVWLGVSGRPAPDYRGPVRGLRPDVTDDELLQALTDMGALPDRLDLIPGFRVRLLDLMRADLRALYSYQPDPARDPVRAPLAAFGGSEDDWAPPASLSGWQHETRAEFRHVTFPGGHFYFLGDAFPLLTDAVIDAADAGSRTVSS